MEDFFTLQYKDEHVIRSFTIDEMLYVALPDVLMTLLRENRKIDPNKNYQSGKAVLEGQLKRLDRDEHRNFRVQGHDGELEEVIFVTEPGLYRVMSGDETEAGKTFQRWMFHEVLTSIRKYGTYPAPAHTSISDPHEATVQLLVESSQRLLVEIQERKRLEQETKAEFKKHKEELKALSESISDINGVDKTGLISIANYMEDSGVSEYDEQIIYARCFKQSIEHDLPLAKPVCGGSLSEYRFTPQVLAEVLEIEKR